MTEKVEVTGYTGGKNIWEVPNQESTDKNEVPIDQGSEPARRHCQQPQGSPLVREATGGWSRRGLCSGTVLR